MRLPFFIRRVLSRFNLFGYRLKLPTAPPAPSDLANAKFRLSHQRKQLAKWDGRVKYGAYNDMTRREIIAVRDSIASKVPYWEDKVFEMEEAR